MNNNFLIKAIQQRRKRLGYDNNNKKTNVTNKKSNVKKTNVKKSNVKKSNVKKTNAARKIQAEWKRYIKNKKTSKINESTNNSTNNSTNMSALFLRLAANNSNRKNSKIAEQNDEIRSLLNQLAICTKMMELRRSNRQRRSTKRNNYVYY